MQPDDLTIDELRQTAERLRQEGAELRKNFQVAVTAWRRTREEVRRQREEVQWVTADQASPAGVWAPEG